MARKDTRPARKPKSSKPAAKAASKPAAARTRRKPAAPKARTRAKPAPVTSPAEDALALEANNRRYYDAFQSLDVEQVARMWWHDDDASCIHPGWDARHGWLMVRNSYEEIFQNTKSIRFALGDVRVRVVGELGFVTCVENLVSEESDTGDFLGAVLATNVFERRRGEWRLVHHHASPFTSDEVDIPEGPLH